jgi:hypothetical protein
MKWFYADMMSHGYKINEIDEMDYFYYMDVFIYRETHDGNDEWDRPNAFIDEV